MIIISLFYCCKKMFILMNTWMKPYIDIKTDLKQKAKNDFEKKLFNVMIDAVFGKTMENARKHSDIKLVTTQRRRNCLVLDQNHYATKFSTEYIVPIEMQKCRFF